MDADSVLELPALDVRTLLGVTVTTPWVSLPTLVRAYPDVDFRWQPRQLRLVVTDSRGSLPAVAAARASLMRAAQGAATLAYRPTTAFFGSLAANDSGSTDAQLGYSWRGRVAVQGDYLPAAHRGFWTGAVVPLPQISLAVSGDHAVRSASLRLAVGHAWAFTTWQPNQLALDGLVAVGPLALFASPQRSAYLLTINPGAGVAVQFSRTLFGKTARVSFGQVVSPFGSLFIPSR